jgi:S-adenosylmethionine-diacylglycerol 3-amino-3-carboxypropyl transferase
LKEDNFQQLRSGLVDRISIHTGSVQGFLEKYNGQISRFVLLDHMDWLSDHFFSALESEWQAIICRAAPDNRLIWRSGGLRTDFIDQVFVMHGGKMERLRPMLSYNSALSNQLHPLDRVHTYGSFYIAHLTT